MQSTAVPGSLPSGDARLLLSARGDGVHKVCFFLCFFSFSFLVNRFVYSTVNRSIDSGVNRFVYSCVGYCQQIH